MLPSAPTQAQDTALEQASAAFVKRYIEEWSGPAPAAIAYMDHIYPDQVYFYGKELSHAALLNLKRKFAMRWPERTLNVRPDSIQVACNPSHLCAAQAVYDWQYRSRERATASSGSASLKLELRDGTTILSEEGSVIPSNRSVQPALVQRAPRPPVAAQPPATTANILTASVPNGRPQQDESGPAPEELSPRWKETSPPPEDIVALRNAYNAHGTDKAWISAWIAEKRDFLGHAIVVGSTEDQAAPGSVGMVRTVGFTSAVGTVACINPDGATSLTVGEKVNLHGVITVFIEDVMYLGQCSIQPA
jgi:hypothetical protein